MEVIASVRSFEFLAARMVHRCQSAVAVPASSALLHESSLCTFVLITVLKRIFVLGFSPSVR